MKTWRSFKYRNIFCLILAIVFSLSLSRSQGFQTFLLGLGEFGYIGAFLAGMLFVSTFTVTTGALILFVLAEKLSPIEIGLIAGLGAVIGDFLIFRFVKDGLLEEIEPIYEELGGKHLLKILHTKYFSWTLPVIGAIIIASPLPDEVGVGLLGIAKMKSSTFLLLSFALNAVGISLVVATSVALTR